jgi:hypothetical protein
MGKFKNISIDEMNKITSTIKCNSRVRQHLLSNLEFRNNYMNFVSFDINEECSLGHYIFDNKRVHQDNLLPIIKFINWVKFDKLLYKN